MNFYGFLAEIINHNLIEGGFLENGIEKVESTCVTSTYLEENCHKIEQTVKDFLQWYEGNDNCIIAPKKIEKVLSKAQQTIALGNHENYDLSWAITRIRCEEARRIQAKLNNKGTKNKARSDVYAIWISLGLVLGLWIFFVPLQVSENLRLQKEIERLEKLING